LLKNPYQRAFPSPLVFFLTYCSVLCFFTAQISTHFYITYGFVYLFTVYILWLESRDHRKRYFCHCPVPKYV
jgi:hypothetical protein